MKDPTKPGWQDALDSTVTAGAEGEPRQERGAPDLRRGTSFDRYVILDRVGEGGMGVVYAAYDSGLERKVALKFLHPDRSEPGSMRERRLLREAHAMARLSHPNVAVVYDVGSTDGHVFLSMEFVEGKDLRSWLAAEPRSASEILNIFVAAGRGLAAAHAAGIVHRDFKPANVLVDAQNRPRVTDFGLSRASPALDHSVEEEGGSPRDDAAGADSPPSSLAVPLTWTGDVLGTPSYMAPEQRSGAPADPRSDQFSFCVALHEALQGEHPFAATGARSSSDDPADRGQARTRAHASVPRWCRVALQRGLRPAPEERFPTMDALLAELSAHPVRRRRRAAIAVALGLFVAGGAAYGLFLDADAASPLPRCDLGTGRLAGVWDPARKSRVRSAFQATGVAGWDRQWNRFARDLDRRTGAWSAMYDDACAATHVRGVQSSAVLDLRVECLDRKLEEMKAIVDVFAGKLDKPTMDRALGAAERLSPVSACADVANLRAVVPLPEDRATRSKLRDLHRRLDRARALYGAGKFEQGRELAASLKRDADALGYDPIAAEAANELADHMARAGKLEEAQELLFRAAGQAASARAWYVEAEIWLSLVIGYVQLGLQKESLLTARVAEVAVARAGARDELRARLKGALGVVQRNAGDYVEALESFQQAAGLRKKTLGADSPAFARELGHAGYTLLWLGRVREGLAQLERSLALRRAALRPDHPDIGASYAYVAAAQARLGKNRKARDMRQAAYEIMRKEFGVEHLDTLYMSIDLAVAESRVGNYTRALELLADVRDRQRLIHPDDTYLSNLHIAHGEVNLLAGHLDEAERSFARAIAHDQRVGADQLNTGYALAGIGHVHNRRGRYGRALRACRRGLKLLARGLGEESGELSVARECIGEALIDSGHPVAARAELDRALASVSELDSDPRTIAALRFHLGRALWSTPAKRARARQLVDTALESLRRAEGDHRALIGRARAWLESHPARARSRRR
jgi:eukaryotic-like serine/threonine-protein kinase